MYPGCTFHRLFAGKISLVKSVVFSFHPALLSCHFLHTYIETGRSRCPLLLGVYSLLPADKNVRMFQSRELLTSLLNVECFRGYRRGQRGDRVFTRYTCTLRTVAGFAQCPKHQVAAKVKVITTRGKENTHRTRSRFQATFRYCKPIDIQQL